LTAHFSLLIVTALAERFVRKMRNLTDLVADAFILNADSSDPFLIMNEITV